MCHCTIFIIYNKIKFTFIWKFNFILSIFVGIVFSNNSLRFSIHYFYVCFFSFIGIKGPVYKGKIQRNTFHVNSINTYLTNWCFSIRCKIGRFTFHISNKKIIVGRCIYCEIQIFRFRPISFSVKSSNENIVAT